MFYFVKLNGKHAVYACNRSPGDPSAQDVNMGMLGKNVVRQSKIDTYREGAPGTW